MIDNARGKIVDVCGTMVENSFDTDVINVSATGKDGIAHHGCGVDE